MDRRLSESLGLLASEITYQQRFIDPLPEPGVSGTARSKETVIERSEGQEAMVADGAKEPETDIISQQEQKQSGDDADEARQAIRREIETLPDVRGEMVDVVQGRIREGFYDRPEVLERIVDRLLNGSPDRETETDLRGEQ